MLKKESPQHMIIQSVQKVLDAMEGARSAKSVDQRVANLLNVARAYAEIGLTDASIDEIYGVLDIDPGNADAIKMLSEAYLLRGRKWPAYAALKQLVKVRPDDEGARLALEKLQDQM